MVYLLLAFLLALIILDFIKNKKLHTPGIIFNGIFFATLFLYIFYLSENQHYLTNKTVFIFFLCIISFNIPVFASYYKKKNNNEYLSIYNKPLMSMSPKLEYTIYYFVMILFICEMIYCKGCPVVWKLLGDKKVYVDFGIPRIHRVVWVFTTMMGIRSLLKKNDYTKFGYLTISVLIISRAMMLFIVLGGIFYKLSSIKKLNWKIMFTLIIIGLSALIAFSFIGNFRTGEEEFLKVARFKKCADWLTTAFKWVYSYMCFSISNINNLFKITSGFVTDGLLTFSSLIPSFINNFIGVNSLTIPEFLVHENFTVSTFMSGIYLDFGILGAVIFCLLLGLFMSWLFNKSKNDNGLRILYALSLCNLTFILFSNLFLDKNFIFETITIIYYCVFRDYKHTKKIKGDIFYERNYFSRGKWN